MVYNTGILRRDNMTESATVQQLKNPADWEGIEPIEAGEVTGWELFPPLAPPAGESQLGPISGEHPEEPSPLPANSSKEKD